MGKFKTSCGLAAVLLVVAAPCAHAVGAARTWVSGIGDDMNPCSRTAPCKTFASAITKTAVGGEISVLDPGGYGAVTITQSITINGTSGAGYGSISAAGNTGITINITDPADAKRTVRLNWLDINGYGSGLQGIRIANTNLAGVSVVVENTTIDGFTGRGISDERIMAASWWCPTRRSGTPLIRRSGSRPAATIDALLSNVRVHNSATAGLTANSGAKVMVSNSVFSGSAIGLDIEQAEHRSDSRQHDHRQHDRHAHRAGAVLRLSNSNVSFNGTGVSGTVNSFSNNQFVANGPGGAITPIGAPTSATGLQ